MGAGLVIKKARPEPTKSCDLWLPCWSSLHPLWLLAFRAFAMVVMCWVSYDIVLVFGTFAFYFYTMWTYLLVLIYFVIAIIVSVHGCWKHSKQLVDESELARKMEDNSPEIVPLVPNKNPKLIKLKSYNELTMFLGSQVKTGKALHFGDI